VIALHRARLLALFVPAALMAGALGSQYIGGLYPCEMCYWQRWPHYAAIVVGLFAFVAREPRHQRLFILLAALGILVSGAIGGFHAGVEYGWWEGLTQCSQPLGAGGGNFMDNIMKAPLVRCDQAQWTLFGISLAGYNMIVSVAAFVAIISLMQDSKNEAR
jgi:disulfide bond formation protein DsbB